MNLYKDKLYIIGSLSQEEVIKSTADYYTRVKNMDSNGRIIYNIYISPYH